jgi:uncharacterized repeat protein (TIGR03803 family)
MKTIRPMLLAAIVAVFATASVQAQNILYSFGVNSTDLTTPSYPGVIAQGLDGNLYSSTIAGGQFGQGGIFKITPGGSYSKFWDFGTLFGSVGYSGLTLGTDGYFYGATITNEIGGGYGGVYKVDAAGTEMTFLHDFNYTDGEAPYAPPIEGADGNFYGTTSAGGLGGDWGTVYKITPSMVFTSLYSFDYTHGGTPYYPLVEGTDGNFYGTTSQGGASGMGTVFKISSAGKLTVLHSFTGPPDGQRPFCALVQASDGNFYGTTSEGGANDAGTAFKISSQGKLTILHSFSLTDGIGYQSLGGLVQGSDGNFYGTNTLTTDIAGEPNGVLYEMTPAGKVTSVVAFQDDAEPVIAPVQHTSGALYGDTPFGGTYAMGMIYDVNQGLKPFAALVSAAGKPGKAIQILGQGFTQATGVFFDGVAAKFAVTSDTFLTATLPAGALSGLVTVKIPTGNLVSKQAFRVLPVVQTFTPSNGSVATPVTINGVSLKQTTAVGFGGVTTTTFTVNSNSQIVVDVPAGAKTGKILVTTAGGSATSSTAFTVTP